MYAGRCLPVVYIQNTAHLQAMKGAGCVYCFMLKEKLAKLTLCQVQQCSPGWNTLPTRIFTNPMDFMYVCGELLPLTHEHLITLQWSTKANNPRSTMILPLSISWTGNALRGGCVLYHLENDDNHLNTLRGEMSSLPPGECFTAECKLHGLTPVLSLGTKPLTRRCMYPSNKCCELLFRKYSVQENIQ